MISIKTISIAGGLASVIILTTAFFKVQNEKAIHNLKAPGSEGFAVVELFTSEGCSSCPPADALIEKIQLGNKNMHLYILAFHVDYWDHQGWKDRFSDHEYSLRQRRYAAWLNSQIYTPQIVVNGTSEHVGSNQGSVLRAISVGLDHKSDNQLTLSGRIEHDQVKVQYQGAGDGKKTELVLALIQKEAKSKVRAGENSGSSLSHVQIVRQMIRYPIDDHTKKGIAMKLPKDIQKENLELIALVQSTSNGKITAAGRFSIESQSPKSNNIQ